MKAIITGGLLLITFVAAAQKKNSNDLPTPVKISAAPVRPAAQEIWLNLQVTAKPELTYWIQTAEPQPVPPQFVKRDSAAVEAVIRQYQLVTKEAGKKLVVLVRSDARTPFADVKPVMDALKATGIYTYKLITDPETKQ